MNDMNILIVKSSSLGDIIHTFPAIGLIKALAPTSKIDWVVESPSVDLVKAHPDIENVIPINTKQWRKNLFSRATIKEMRAFRQQLQAKKYDLVFDFQGNSKSGLITWLSKSATKIGFAKSRVPEWPNLLATNRRYLPPFDANIREDYLYLAQSYFQNFAPHEYLGTSLKLNYDESSQLEAIKNKIKASDAPPIMVCAGSNWKNKQLSNEALHDFLKLVLQHQTCQLIFVWGSEKERLNAISMADQLPHSIVLDKMSLPLLQHVMNLFQHVIAMDSLALHLAATTKTPTFSVFGASLASKYKPLGNHHFALQGSCPYKQTFETRCPKLRRCDTGACIRNLSGQTIFNAWLEQAQTIIR